MSNKEIKSLETDFAIHLGAVFFIGIFNKQYPWLRKEAVVFLNCFQKSKIFINIFGKFKSTVF